MNRQERRAGLAQARHTRNEWHPFERLNDDPEWVARHYQRIVEHAARTGDLIECWANNLYSVQVFARARPGAAEVKHLAIRRHDSTEIQGWDDLQRIKNEVAGPELAALEVYPPQAEVMDQAPMRHLFVLPLGEAAPFTIVGRWS